MTRRDMATLLVLASIWGGSFLFIRIASPAFGPIALMAGRLVLAAVALLAYGGLTRNLPPIKDHWRQYLFLGITNSALPFVLIAFAALQLPASLTATLNATTPLFGALVSAAWLGEGISLRKAFGLALGLIGVATLVGFGPLWGVLLLHEVLGVGALVGFALILTSVAFVTGSAAVSRKMTKPRTAEGA